MGAAHGDACGRQAHRAAIAGVLILFLITPLIVLLLLGARPDGLQGHVQDAQEVPVRLGLKAAQGASYTWSSS